MTTVQTQGLWTYSISEASEELVDNVPLHIASALKKTDVYIFTVGPKNLHWDDIPTGRRHLVTKWFLENNKFAKQWRKIAATMRVKMLGIEATLADPERAKTLGLDFLEWRRVMFEGCLVDYGKMSAIAKRLARLMEGDGEVRVTTPHGTNFTFSLDRRPVDWFDGIVRDEWVAIGRPAFLPAGGIEVSVNEKSGQGSIVFDQPILSLLKEGRLEGLKLTVERGRIRAFSASRQKEAFGRWLNDGKGSTDRLAFFGFGLNHKLRHGFTQDDKVLGGVTIGFGDNSDKKGKNKADRGFWASMTKATVTIGDKTVMKNGQLLI